MFFAHWLSPGLDQGGIKISAVRELSTHYILECVVAIDWNDRLSDLVDAGIPVRIRVLSYSDIGDTLVSIKTLQCNLRDYTYNYCDSVRVGGECRVSVSKQYHQIFLAVRDYTTVTRSFSRRATILYVEALLLPSSVSHLNRSIDISELCGARKYFVKFEKKRE